MLNKNKRYQTKYLVSRLITECLLSHKVKIRYAFGCMVLGAMATAALPYSLKPFFDRVFIKGEMHMLVFVAVMIFVTFLVKGASAYGENVLMSDVGQETISSLQKKLFRHLMDADLSFFHTTPSGDLLSRFTHDVGLMRNAMATTLISLGKDTLSLIFLIGLMFYMDFILASIAFVVFPCAVFPIINIGKRMRKVSHTTQDHYAGLCSQLSQIFQGIRAVKAYGMEGHETRHIDHVVHGIAETIQKATRIKALSHPIVESMGGLAIVIVIAYGGYQVIHHNRTPGDFMAFIASLLLVYEPLKRLSTLNATLQEGLAATARIFDLLDQPSKIQNTPDAKEITTVEGHIFFKNVSFLYDPSRAENQILNNISFHVKPGQTIAFVGPSGSGKSTLMNLIPRFYEVSKGSIAIDGHDIRSFTLQSLRRHIALVSQETVLFDRTIFENIAYSEHTYSLDDVIAASKAAAAHEFIEKLPQGYETLVGENGVKLSGGQRQRIAIARAMLKNAPILLLDEATSALDSDSERLIQEALERLMQGKTTIVIAHRLSTIVDADCIFVLNNGMIVEKGVHTDLLNQEGLYAKLWRKQAMIHLNDDEDV